MREDVVARRWEKAWNPIRAEGSGGKTPPLSIFCLHPPPFLRRGRESEGWEEQFFPISGHQREKVWRWGVVGVEQETGAGNDVEGEQEKVL